VKIFNQHRQKADISAMLCWFERPKKPEFTKAAYCNIFRYRIRAATTTNSELPILDPSTKVEEPLLTPVNPVFGQHMPTL
jgi:hypothetical protein